MSGVSSERPKGSQGVELQQGVAPTYPLITEDTGVHTNPEQWLHDHHWDTPAEIVLAAAAAVNMGAAVAAGRVRRIREITVRNTAQANTVITLSVAGVNLLSFDVPQGTTRTWSSDNGRDFAAGSIPQIASSGAGVGTETFVSASGVEAAQS